MEYNCVCVYVSRGRRTCGNSSAQKFRWFLVHKSVRRNNGRGNVVGRNSIECKHVRVCLYMPSGVAQVKTFCFTRTSPSLSSPKTLVVRSGLLRATAASPGNDLDSALLSSALANAQKPSDTNRYVRRT